MSRKRKLNDKDIQEILENNLSDMESDSSDDDDLGHMPSFVHEFDYDSVVLRGLSKIIGPKIDDVGDNQSVDDCIDNSRIRTSEEIIQSNECERIECDGTMDQCSDEIVELVDYLNIDLEEADQSPTPVNIIDNEEVISSITNQSPTESTQLQPSEEIIRVVVIENEDSGVIPIINNNPPVPTQHQSVIINQNRPEDTDLSSFRRIRIAQEWSSKVPKHHIPKFDRVMTINNMTYTHKTPPICYFDKFFPDSICELLTEQTNLYATQKGTLNWTPTNKREIRAFLGVLIMMGLNPLPDCNLYWSTDPFYRNPDISQAFTAKRFKKLTENIHISDNSQEPTRDSPDYDKLYKIRALINVLNTIFQNNNTQSSNQSVDECMVKFKGKSTLKQYMPKKPIKRGYKIWARCDATTGYIYQFDVYIGKADENASSEDGLGYNVVIKLCEGVPPNTLVAFDNFFTGVPLMLDLLTKKGIYAVGTVRLNRKGLPKSILPQNKSRKEKLAKHEFTYQSKSPISIIQWMDTQLVNVLTTAHDPKSLTVVKRTQKDGSKKDIPIPTAIAEYTINMGGVDHFDHFRSSYPIGRKSRRNWMRLFYFMFDASVINSYLTYLRIHKQSVHTHREYRLRLARGLIDGFTNKKTPTEIVFRNKKNGNFGIPDEIRLCSSAHFPEDQKKFTRCRFCSTKNHQKRSRVRCDVCKVALCATPCFKSFHSPSLENVHGQYDDSTASSSTTSTLT